MVIAILMIVAAIIGYIMYRSRSDSIPVWVWIVGAVGLLFLLISIGLAIYESNKGHETYGGDMMGQAQKAMGMRPPRQPMGQPQRPPAFMGGGGGVPAGTTRLGTPGLSRRPIPVPTRTSGMV